MNIKYEWEEGKSCPLGYPVEVYKGGFRTKEGDFVSLYGGVTTGERGWGSPDNGMSNGKKVLPDHLHVQWLSFTEDALFEIDTDIDKEKIAACFREGYKRRAAGGEIRPENFDQVVAGFAPGGVVVVWVSGAGVEKEIGRYQGRKIKIPQSEIDALDPSDQQLFDKAYRKQMLTQNNVVPLAVQKANKDKPIPYGLWDTYRVRYHWRPVFRIPDGGKMGDFALSYLNGECDHYFYESNIQNENDPALFFQQDDTATLAIPKEIGFNWRAQNNKKYAGYFRFNDQEVLKAFQEICGADKDVQIEMRIEVSLANSYASILLRGSNGKEEPLAKHDEDSFVELKE